MKTSRIIQQIEAKRKSLRYSQTSFAETIGMTKNGYQNIIKVEDIKMSLFLKAVEVLQVPVSYFFEEDYTNGGHQINGTGIIGSNNKVVNDKKDFEHLKEKLADAQKLIEEKERHLEELRQRVLDKEEIIKLIDNK